MTATIPLFRNDAYLKQAPATVVAITEAGDVVLDQTLFYPLGGGQPGDCGIISCSGKVDAVVVDTRNSKDVAGQILHKLQSASELVVGDQVTMHIDWEVRYRRMRVHTALHLLSVALPFPVTGGSIGECLTDSKVDGRLDFDIAEVDFTKESLTEQLQQMIASPSAVTSQWITDEELDAKPELVKTMSVQPPRGAGKVRLVNIDGLDLQPCGGTHLANIAEIGPIRVSKIENKGKINRRVRIILD